MVSFSNQRLNSKVFEVDLEAFVKVVAGKSRVKTSPEQKCKAVNIGHHGICLLLPEMEIGGFHVWGSRKKSDRNHLKLRVKFPWEKEPSLNVNGLVEYFEKIRYKGKECFRVFVHFEQPHRLDSIRLSMYMEKLNNYLQAAFDKLD